MKTNHFEGIKGQEAMRRRFLELCKAHHPDMGGDTATMQEINAQYERLSNILGGLENKESDRQTFRDWWKHDKALSEIIAKVIRCEGVTIEVMGGWLWISGETFQHCATFKALGMFWSKPKKAWYWNGQKFKTKFAKFRKLADVRDSFGSTHIETQVQKKIAV